MDFGHFGSKSKYRLSSTSYSPSDTDKWVGDNESICELEATNELLKKNKQESRKLYT